MCVVRVQQKRVLGGVVCWRRAACSARFLFACSGAPGGGFFRSC